MSWIRDVGEPLVSNSVAVIDLQDRYNSPEASRVTHRASEQYKTFRSAVGREALLERPSDLEFWQSTDIGFLTKEEQVKFSPREECDQLQCVVTDELAVASTSKKQLLDQLRKIAERARLESDVLSFWVLDRDSAESSSAGTENDVYVFMRFSSETAWKAYRDTNLPTEWEMVGDLATNRRTTTWEEAGIGFLGR